MNKYNLVLLCGGGGSEHDISLLSAKYFESCLASLPRFNTLWLELTAEGQYRTREGEIVELTNRREIRFADEAKAPWPVDYVIPCIHGYPGETGDIQSWFNLIRLPYFGCGSEASSNCFNKITAKMWFSALGIPNTPYLYLDEPSDEAIARVEAAFDEWGSVFIKAASQGSSVGCFPAHRREDIPGLVCKAFEYAPFVVVEKTIKARELEVAVYEYEGEIVATRPGEIVCAANTFYSFEEKYDTKSQAITHVEAPNVDEETVAAIRDYAVRAFKGMKLRHLSRIDFFLTPDNQILLNEINTFPGLTQISMFPKMLAHHGHDFATFLEQAILAELEGR
ncbi:D-alanine--D-alanine ligase [Shewanella sp. FJAT-52076]|uniref:D-alanine--D-alanine ligase n=1 Tax=Shewanella sp. FJAT-52076 TaxID=2864202 RepID=UPI001C65ADAF|nr:D-alanine--D-alanine ligase [Shewanella sp. FJAT-52076]QYJ73712.1 D-alanine--D-alanine ligase [Shewanella sp. FJAT-52076]